jgi:hypothetical protein
MRARRLVVLLVGLAPLVAYLYAHATGRWS